MKKKISGMSKMKKIILTAAVFVLCLSIGIGVYAITEPGEVKYTTIGGEWEQQDENTWTMDTDNDGKADITLIKNGDTWKYLFQVADPAADYYAWEEDNLKGYEIVDGKGSRETPVGTYSVKYSHTDNVDDEGKMDGGYTVPYEKPVDVVRIPGAESLSVTLTYQTDSYSRVCVWEGDASYYTPSSDYGTADKTYSSTGSNPSKATAEFKVEGDTVTFGFYSTSKSENNYYGYYAVVEPVGDGSVITNKSTDELPGGFTLKKLVSGGDAEDSQENFQFHITLSAEDAEDSKIAAALEGSRIFGDVTFTDGEALAFLKDGETLTVSNLLPGIKWTIEEVLKDGYTISWNGGTKGEADNIRYGTVEAKKVTNVVCTNTKQPEEKKETGAVTVKKTVENGSSEDEFTYHMLFWNLDADGNYRMEGERTVSHTLNVDDNGKKIKGYTTQDTTNVVTIPGAEALHVTLTYQTYNTSYGWVCMWEGAHKEYKPSRNSGTSRTGKLGGKTRTTKEYDVPGDSVTFGFRSTSTSGDAYNYGYYAVVTAASPFTADASGMADIEFTLKDGESKTFAGLPVGCQYQVREEASGYIASYEIENASDVSQISGGNLVENNSLLTARETLDQGEAATVHFTNSRTQEPETESLDIQVTKEWVDDNNAQGIRPEYITVYLTQDEDVAASARLDEASGWKTNFTGLPKYHADGVTEYAYDIQEVSVPGYSTVILQPAEDAEKQVFTIQNIATEVGSLKVSKKVEGKGADASKDFQFTVTLTKDEDPVTGVYELDGTAGTKAGTIAFDENGKASFTLKAEESIVIKNLPAGAAYSVSEAAYTGYAASIEDAGNGTIPVSGTASVNVTNKDTRTYYDLSVSKTVTGNLGDRKKEFRFRLTLTGGNVPGSLDYQKGDETGTLALDNGSAEFTLSHNETIMFEDILENLTYKVEELDGESDGYKVESENESGALTGDTTVSFTNSKGSIVPTSADTNIRVLFLCTVAAGAGILWIVYRRRKQTSKKTEQ